MSAPFIPVKRAPFRLDLLGRHAPIPAFMMDPDTKAQVLAGMDMVIPGMPQKKPWKMQPSKCQPQPPAVLRVTLRSGQPHPDDVPNPEDDIYYKAVHRDSHHVATTAAVGGPAAVDPGHDAGEENDMGKPDHPLLPAAELHCQACQ